MRDDDGGGGSSNFSSIQFEGMRQLISQVRTAGSTLQETTEGFQTRASGYGVSSPAFSQIIEIGSWAEEQLPQLERRLTLASAAQEPGGTPLSGWTVDEPISMTADEATEKGEDLAQQILDHNRTDEDFVEITDDTLDELMSKYSNDPDVLSAFYAKLGPQLQSMPALLYGSGAQDTVQLEKISNSLALAMRDPNPPEAFTEVLDMLKTPTGHEPDPVNWDRLALLQWGDFPPDFVAEVVKANGLDKLNGDDDNVDWRGGMATRLGLGEDTRTLIFGALKNDPEATRMAFEGLDMDHIVDQVYAEGSFDFELQENFIEAMKAGSGTNDESMGYHSDEAAEFAFAFIKASASEEDVPDVWVTKEGLAAIAASYAPEFVAGSNSMDAIGHGSSMGMPDNYDLPPGPGPEVLPQQRGHLQVPPRLRRDGRALRPAARLLRALRRGRRRALPEVAVRGRRGDEEAPELRRLAGHPAHLRQPLGLHLQAQLDVRGDQDAADQHNKDLMAGLLLKGVGFIPTPQGLVLKGGLMAGKFLAGKAIKAWRTTDPETTRQALLEDADLQASFLTDYQLFSALTAADYPGTGKVPPELLDDGQLISPDRIAQDPDLFQKYHDWVDSTDGPTDADLDSMTELGKGQFRGGLDEGQNNGEGYGW